MNNEKPSRPWVVFDFGGVILTMRDKTCYIEKMKEVMEHIGYTGSDPSTFKKRCYGGEEFNDAKEGRIDCMEMWRRIFANPDNNQAASIVQSTTVSLDDDTVMRLRDYVRLNGRHVDPRLVTFMRSLQQRGVGVAILSNYESDLLPVLESLGEIRSVFESTAHIISSYDLRCGKPKVRCYELAMERLGVRPSPIQRDDDGNIMPGAQPQRQPTNDSSLLEAAISSTDVYSSSSDACNGSLIADGGELQGYPNVVFVDDKDKNVDAAVKAGIAFGFVYRDLDQCIRDVESAVAKILARIVALPGTL